MISAKSDNHANTPNAARPPVPTRPSSPSRMSRVGANNAMSFVLPRGFDPNDEDAVRELSRQIRSSVSSRRGTRPSEKRHGSPPVRKPSPSRRGKSPRRGRDRSPPPRNAPPPRKAPSSAGDGPLPSFFGTKYKILSDRINSDMAERIPATRNTGSKNEPTSDSAGSGENATREGGIIKIEDSDMQAFIMDHIEKTQRKARERCESLRGLAKAQDNGESRTNKDDCGPVKKEARSRILQRIENAQTDSSNIAAEKRKLLGRQRQLLEGKQTYHRIKRNDISQTFTTNNENNHTNSNKNTVEQNPQEPKNDASLTRDGESTLNCVGTTEGESSSLTRWTGSQKRPTDSPACPNDNTRDDEFAARDRCDRVDQPLRTNLEEPSLTFQTGKEDSRDKPIIENMDSLKMDSFPQCKHKQDRPPSIIGVTESDDASDLSEDLTMSGAEADAILNGILERLQAAKRDLASYQDCATGGEIHAAQKETEKLIERLTSAAFAIRQFQNV